MELSEYKNIFDHETTHFFYKVNHQLILAQLQKYGSEHPKGKLKILDAGCGTGLLLKKLSRYGQAQGVDISPEAIKFCRRRKVKATRGSLNKLPFASHSFDVVVSMDVLYHQLVNQKAALKEIKRVLKPGGIFIVRVPANKWLKLAHDRHVHTRQRYSTADLTKALIEEKFTIKKITYVNQAFLLLAMLKYAWELIKGTSEIESGVGQVPTKLNNLLVAIGLLEVNLLSFISFPFGLGVLAVAQKPM